MTPIGEIVDAGAAVRQGGHSSSARKLRATMPMTTTTVQMMRQEDRY
ncbi:MAG: hypothetical protein IPL72_07680 [Sulfuritalea sp.]|nr:hypothetical protein [Sulfuritalea sp.]